MKTTSLADVLVGATDGSTDRDSLGSGQSPEPYLESRLISTRKADGVQLGSHFIRLLVYWEDEAYNCSVCGSWQ